MCLYKVMMLSDVCRVYRA